MDKILKEEPSQDLRDGGEAPIDNNKFTDYERLLINPGLTNKEKKAIKAKRDAEEKKIAKENKKSEIPGSSIDKKAAKERKANKGKKDDVIYFGAGTTGRLKSFGYGRDEPGFETHGDRLPVSALSSPKKVTFADEPSTLEKKSKKGDQSDTELNEEYLAPVLIPFGERLKALIQGVLKAKDMAETKEAFVKFRQKSTGEKVSDVGFSEPPEVLDLPVPGESENCLASYWLIPPHAYASIHLNEDGHIQYSLIEPKVSESEYILMDKVTDYLRRTQILDVIKDKKEVYIDRNTLVEAIRYFEKEITDDRLEVLLYYLKQNFFGYGRLDSLLRDDRIEDITCNGEDVPIYLYHRDYGNIITNFVFDKEDLNKYVLKLAQKADKQLSLTSPLVDAALPNGARAQLTYTDVVSAKGSSFTIRKFKSEPMTPIDLIRWNTYSSEMMAYIWLAVENRKSMIVAGGTASGKTSTMNAISFFIPTVSKIVSIEDTLEIQLPHGNWLAMKTRESIVNTQSSITMFSLLKAALRQRPEYIIMGEVRGSEAQALFQAMNTGHTTFSTLHAGSVNEAVNRLTHDPINVPVAMFDALDLIVTQSLMYQDGAGFRRATSLNEIYIENNVVKYTPLFVWDHKTDTFIKQFGHSRVFDNIRYQNGWSLGDLLDKVEEKKKALDALCANQEVTLPEIVVAIDKLSMQTSKKEILASEKDGSNGEKEESPSQKEESNGDKEVPPSQKGGLNGGNKTSLSENGGVNSDKEVPAKKEEPPYERKDVIADENTIVYENKGINSDKEVPTLKREVPSYERKDVIADENTIVYENKGVNSNKEVPAKKEEPPYEDDSIVY